MIQISTILEGDRLALARLLTQVENDSPEGRAALAELFPHTGKARPSRVIFLMRSFSLALPL